MRPPTVDEYRLLCALIDRAKDLKIPEGSLESLSVEEMNDGGMGSLSLFYPLSSPSRKMKSQVSELQFIDVDGVVVIASLNIDENDMPFELDVWKTNFEPLINISNEFTDVNYDRSRQPH